MPIFPTIKLNIERWKYNPTFELYVSNMGHIKNKSKADIAPKIMQNGYVVVYVHGSLNRYMLLHRVVMLTWCPTPEAEELTVDHLDHNKRNNALSNLEWVTLEENQRRAAHDYLCASTLVGNDVIVSTPSNPSKPITKKKRNAADIIGVVIRNKVFNGATISPVFIKRDNEEDLLDFCAPYVGKVNNFTIGALRNVLKGIYSGKNCNGYKKWCGFEILAVYSDDNLIEKMEEGAK